MAEQTNTNQTGNAQNHTEPPDSAIQRWKRRGLLAAAWAAVAGVVLKETTQPVSAGVDGDVVLGAANTTTTQTNITDTTVDGVALQVIANAGTDGWGLEAAASGYGVIGRSNITGNSHVGAGVYGETAKANSFGVFGNSDPGTGVFGQTSTGLAIYGLALGAGPAMKGEIPAGTTANAIAIYGLNNSSFAGPGPGAGGFGVYGLSAKGHGLVGATAAPGAAAVVGASNGVVGANAGAFYGPVVVSGAFTVVGGPKSAAVPHPDGSHRRLYCVESPESWFEDFGKSQLDCGRADVTIDPTFRAVTDLTDYHVFLTSYDDFELRVSEQTPVGFRVQAKDAAATGRFSWRLVAKRKDIEAPRFEAVTIPPEPTLPTMSEAPTPQRPSPRQAGKSGGPLG